MVMSPPAMQKTRVPSLGWEDPLEKGMAIHSSILAWGIPRTEEPGGLQFTGLHRVGHDQSNLAHTQIHTHIYEIKSCMFFRRKAMINLDHVLKSKDIIFLTKVDTVKAMAFPVVMYGWESWTIKAESRMSDAFKL